MADVCVTEQTTMISAKSFYPLQQSGIIPLPIPYHTIPFIEALIPHLLYTPFQNLPLPQVKTRDPILRDDLLPQHANELGATNALIRTILNKQRLRPKPETRLAVLADEVEWRYSDAATSFASVVAALLDDGAHALVHLRVNDGN
jgi:hypothetical protein